MRDVRAFDAPRTGSFLGLPALLALCSALLGKSLKGGLVAVGGLNLGGTIDPVHNAVSVAELAVERGATAILSRSLRRKQLNDLSDEMAMKLSVLYYADSRERCLKPSLSRPCKRGRGSVSDLSLDSSDVTYHARTAA